MIEDSPQGTGVVTSNPYVEVQQSPEFVELRRKFRGFVFPATVFFLVWYFAYVLLTLFASSFMSQEIVGNINVGLVLGLLQFVTTFALTILYVRWADREFDPRADAIRRQLEGDPQSAPAADGR